MRNKLHIDIETYSSVDIVTSGAYKYMESPDFEILLICYAYNDEPIQTIDLARGSKMDDLFISRLMDATWEKHAHNANFERNAFRKIGYDVPVKQWRCSAIKSAYCGLPISLEKVSKALKLGEKGKLSTGKALIKYFSCPIKPTKTNGMRYRNLPHHDLEKWNEYVRYCINDVEAEREIDNILDEYEIPEWEWNLYALDQKINDRGILVDLQFAKNAYEIDQRFSEDLFSELKEITGLENPNSPVQLKDWLSNAMKENITTLAKETVKELVKKAEPGTVKDVLQMRLKGSKTSTKKYVAMIKCAGEDSRIRGLFQHYGANRTGRWAGRLVQMQNLPQNHLEFIEMDRALVSGNQYDVLTLTHDNIPDVLSQLIRTAFIAPPGKTFAVSDFSAIEARVIAWLAGEQWRLDVFNTHGKIYEASAAMMFGVPIESVTKGSDMRQKGKVAELALGYQGSIGAMTNMGGEKMGLSEEDMKSIVTKWRKANPKIVNLWNDMENCAIRAVKHKKKVISKFKGLIFEGDKNYLTIQLPSGRKLFYRGPVLCTNKWGKEAIKYKGMDQTTGQWVYIDTYGGKLVENIVQAISRDLLAYSMLILDEEGFDIVLHVHDEVVAEVPENDAKERLDRMCEIMGFEVPWAKGLPLKGDGYITKFYKKD